MATDWLTLKLFLLVKLSWCHHQVLFHLLDCVRTSSTTADKEKIESGGGNILIHHSRDTAEKQWAETWVLTLAGVARIFNTRRYLLQQLGEPNTIYSWYLKYRWNQKCLLTLFDHIPSHVVQKLTKQFTRIFIPKSHQFVTNVSLCWHQLVLTHFNQ